jgi:hypothetical protein
LRRIEQPGKKKGSWGMTLISDEGSGYEVEEREMSMRPEVRGIRSRRVKIKVDLPL